MLNRVVDITHGIAMVITDIHGDWKAYQAYRSIFLKLHSQNLVQYWILCGDYIHHPRWEEDKSLAILQDLYALKKKHGDHIIPLCGNHEFPHIYNIPLSKGDRICTTFLEEELAFISKEERHQLISFLKSLPLYIRTSSGVMLCHAGAYRFSARQSNLILTYFDHDALYSSIETKMDQLGREELIQEYESHLMLNYAELMQQFFKVDDPTDPRYYCILRSFLLQQNEDFNLIWNALFSRNEKEFGETAYCQEVLPQFLKNWSKTAPATQNLLVSGHISVENGFQIIGDCQLRMASYAHAEPQNAGKYLLLDCGKKELTMSDLLEGLKPFPCFS